MIHDVRKVAKDEPGYGRRRFTFPGGSVHVFIVNDDKLAEVLDRAASGRYAVEDAVPPSTRN